MFHLLVLVSKLVPILLAKRLEFSGKSPAVPARLAERLCFSLFPAGSWQVPLPAGACISSTSGYCNATSHTFSLFTWSSCPQRGFRVETLVRGLILIYGNGGILQSQHNYRWSTEGSVLQEHQSRDSPGLHNYRIRCYCSSAHQTNAAKNKTGRHSSPKAQEGSGM